MKEDEKNNNINIPINSQKKIIYRNLRNKEINNNININNKSSISDKNKNRANIIKDFFGLSENKTNYIKINPNYFGLYDENSSSITLLSKPINNDNDNDNMQGFDNIKKIIINKILMNFDDFDFNNQKLNKIFNIYNSSKSNIENINITAHDILLQKIINIVLNNDKLLSIINFRLSLELIENLILGLNNNNFYINKYSHIIIKKYNKILNDINAILLKSNSTKTKIYKYAYQYFEESFILNKKSIQIIYNDCLNEESTYLLLNMSKNKDKENNSDIKIKKFKNIDFPTKEHESLQCLFQLLIGLYDIKILFQFEHNNSSINNNQNNLALLRNIEFPLQLVNSNLDIGKNINIKELKIEPVPIIYKYKDIEYPNYYIFSYLNYFFIVTQIHNNNNKNKINELFLIKDRIPLRQIVAYADRGEPRALYLLKEESDIETKLFFDNVLKASNMKENINNAIKLANVKEFSKVKTFINNLICI